MCSSPQLIAAYHVLLRLLEPRHPPCALICFKTIQIFYGVLPPLIDLKRSKSYSVLQLFFPICQRAIPRFQGLADVVIMNHQTAVFTASTPLHVKRTSATSIRIASDPASCSASGCCATLHRAIVFKQPPAVLVEDIGVEPMTPCLQSRCSSQLS